MNLLLIHNNYGVYSGEETVVDQQVALFREMGHTVSVYRKTTEGSRNTTIGNIKGLLQSFYSPFAVRDIKLIMKKNKPDIVIVHNLYPYISPAILKYIKKAGVPIIMTVHNFRLICPTGLFMRNSKPCELCLKKKNEWSCIRYNCEHSIPKSIGYAARNWYARITKAYKDNIDIYVCITQFQIEKLKQAGYDYQKLIHIPNFLPSFKKTEFKFGNYIAISGRLSYEKGIDLALEIAKQTPNIQYVFAGSRRKEESLPEDIPKNCTFLGHVSKQELSDFYKNARFLLNMSRCYEGFPMTILEAASFEKPAIGPAHAGFLEIIKDHETGLLFKPGNTVDLQKKIELLWNNETMCLTYGKNAYNRLITNYSLPVVKNSWESILKKVDVKYNLKN